MFFKSFARITEFTMKVQLSPECIETLEEITGKKITRNADQVIREVAEIAENAESKDSIEMNVCDSTKKEMKQVG